MPNSSMPSTASNAPIIRQCPCSGRNWLAVLGSHQRHTVVAPDFSKGIALCKQGSKSCAVDRHGLGAEGVQCHKHVVVSSAKASDPVLRRARPGVADQRRACGGPGCEGTERLEGECRGAAFHFQGDQARPGDADVEAIVGLRRGGSAGLSPGPGSNPTCQSWSVVICGVTFSSPLTSRPSSLRAAA